MPTTPQHACFIIHAHKPYCFDFNEILALPSGFRYRNRFDKQWVQNQLQSDVEALQGKRVLLILRDPDNNYLLPVRWGKIMSAQLVGRVAYFEYRLADIIHYNSASNVRTQEIIDHTTTFGTHHSWLPGTHGQALTTPAVFMSSVGDQFSTAAEDDLSAWGNVVSAIAVAPIYENVEFLKIVGLHQADGSPVPIENECMMVRPKTVYKLRVFQHVPNPTNLPVAPHSIEVTTFPAHIVALRPRQQAVGKYDMLTFVLKTLALAPGERTAMEIPHNPEPFQSGVPLTSLYLPLAVRRSNPGRLIAFLIAAAVSLFVMFRPSIIGLPIDVVRNVATIAFVLILTGPSRTLANLWPSWPWKDEK